ncbi:MAG: VWA domain-containing protein [bacterium]|nr:VWA domain-containing protein [bacterium]
MKPLMRTHLPDGFTPAHPPEIEMFCRKAKVPAVAPAFFQDLLNVARGGEQTVMDEAQVEKQVEDLIQEQPLLDRDKLLKYHQNVRGFLKALAEKKTLDNLPGTALEKAAALLKMMAEKSKSESGGSGEEADALPIFLERDGEELSNQTADCLEAAQNLDDIDQELLDTKAPNGNSPLSVVEVAEKIGQSTEWELVRLSHLLDDLVELKTSKKRSTKSSLEPTAFVRTRGIRDFSELPKVARVAHGLPDEIFWQRAVEKRLPVREYVKVDEQKQLIYLLVDCSGSMGDGKRVVKAGGILLNRVKAVIRGEAELFLRLFDGSPHDLKEARNEQQGRELLDMIKNKGTYSGGSTNFSAAISQAVKDINADKARFHRCDIIMVTDGDDSLGTHEPLGDIKLHVFSVASENEALKNIATSHHLVNDNMKFGKGVN